MPARDIYETVKNAVIKDGWTITHVPYVLHWGDRGPISDPEVVREFAAAKNDVQIAVSMFSLPERPQLEDLQYLLGHFVICSTAVKLAEPRRILYTALNVGMYTRLSRDLFGK